MSTTVDPNDKLGKEIFEALAQKGLVNTLESADFLSKLVQGTVKESDWKLAIEMAIRKPQSQTTNETSTTGTKIV